jgi:23S rRNA (cytidine1920-2'-O)/16S rRNA (cytidine1409-2'-O)-methyltransferase
LTGARTRLDQWLVALGLFPSREQARAAILAGRVTVNGKVSDKAGEAVPPGAEVAVDSGPKYVGRGGDKLAGALAALDVDVTGLVALDAGAATGGFVDCLLQHGAAHVIAVDVGYGQLAWRLRQDRRVTVVERQNLRHLTPELLASLLAPGLRWPELVTLDLSFIGLDKVFAPVRRLLRPGGRVLALVKPQFEVGPGQVGKRGVVRRPAQHVEALRSTTAAALANGYAVEGMTHSPLRGPEGNIEFFLLLRAVYAGHAAPKGEPGELEKIGPSELRGEDLRQSIEQVVAAAWRLLEA